MSATRPHALVIGGSLGGLCAGVCLRAAGWRVNIFERSQGVMDDRGAGIVLQSETLNLLEGLKLATCAEISVESHERQYLNKDGGIRSKEGGIYSSGASRQFMTSWGSLFNSLRRGFPDEDYHAGFKLVQFRPEESRVIAEFENGSEETGSLLVGGDGAWSTVRQQLLPELSAEYAGYVAWRWTRIREGCANLVTQDLPRQIHVLPDAAQPHPLLCDSRRGWRRRRRRAAIELGVVLELSGS
jgi:2-polyprenyl-6-methoxyphenol hydroxylase-like FAD-dependent oxidoreductase